MGARPPFSKGMVLKYGRDAEDVVNRIQKISCGDVLKRPPHGKVVKQAAGLKTSRRPIAKVLHPSPFAYEPCLVEVSCFLRFSNPWRTST